MNSDTSLRNLAVTAQLRSPLLSEARTTITLVLFSRAFSCEIVEVCKGAERDQLFQLLELRKVDACRREKF